MVKNKDQTNSNLNVAGAQYLFYKANNIMTKPSNKNTKIMLQTKCLLSLEKYDN